MKGVNVKGSVEQVDNCTKEGVREAIEHVKVFIYMDRDEKDRVTITEVEEMFRELEVLLGLEE